MKKNFTTLTVLFALALTLFGDDSSNKQKTAEEMIRDFTSSYQKKVAKEEKVIFGIEIQGEGGGKWCIMVEPGQKVTIHEGKPKKPTFYFTTDLETLRKIHKGELNALTAAGKARASDPAPLDIKFMEGAPPWAEVQTKVLHVIFHFFVMGSPEIVYFGEEHSRFVHGGNAAIFYYAKGLRTGWYQIKKGMIINQDERDQVNPFPTLIICIRGEGQAKLGEKVMTLKKGMTVYIPTGMSHMFWNEKEEPCEFIIIMFGEGA